MRERERQTDGQRERDRLRKSNPYLHLHFDILKNVLEWVEKSATEKMFTLLYMQNVEQLERKGKKEGLQERMRKKEKEKLVVVQ